MNGDKKLLLKGGKLVKSKSGKLLLWTTGCVCCDQPPDCANCKDCIVSPSKSEDLKVECEVEGFNPDEPIKIMQGYTKYAMVWPAGPADLEYKPEYLENPDNCIRFWWRANNTCVVASVSLGPPGFYRYVATDRERWTYYECRNKSLVDITSDAVAAGTLDSLQTFGIPPGGATGSASAACPDLVPCPDDPDEDFLKPTLECKGAEPPPPREPNPLP
jgi:hypothetical protein